MMIRGWDVKYNKILRDFSYHRQEDKESALLLDSILKHPIGSGHLKSLILDQPVFVIGAGPSITRSLPILKKHKTITKIAADSAVRFLLENKIYPDIVVTDLDGDKKSLLKAAQKSIMVVHAHGDNIDQLHMATKFPKCIGTTQTKPVGKILNFGGFTDGDRSVFLANHFKAKKIILLGMDFGTKIGRYSQTKKSQRQLKLQKLKEAESLLTWLATKNHAIFSTSDIKGITKITYKDIDDIIIT